MPSKQAAMVGFALAALLTGCATGRAAGGDGTLAAEPEDSSAVAAVRAAAIHFDHTRAVEPLEPLRAGLGRRASPNPTRS